MADEPNDHVAAAKIDQIVKGPVVKQGLSNSTPSLQALPGIMSLLQQAEGKETLLQQSTYLSKQVKASVNAMHLAVGRLADESLLVEPGVDKTSAWSAAAGVARDQDADLVTTRLQDGNEHVDRAVDIIIRLRKLAS